MAGSDVIEAAIGITLLLIVSYVVLGSITTAAVTVSNAKKDLTISEEERLTTNMDVTYAHVQYGTYHEIVFRIKNTGNRQINYTDLNMVVITQGSPETLLINNIGTGIIVANPGGTWRFDGIYRDESWNADVINPNKWDPGEFLYGWIGLNLGVDPHPIQFWVFTPNGVAGCSTVT